MTKLCFDIYDTKMEEIEDLRKAAGLDSYYELFNQAMSLFSWAFRNAAKNRKIAAVNEKGEICNVVDLETLDKAEKTDPKAAH